MNPVAVTLSRRRLLSPPRRARKAFLRARPAERLPHRAAGRRDRVLALTGYVILDTDAIVRLVAHGGKDRSATVVPL